MIGEEGAGASPPGKPRARSVVADVRDSVAAAFGIRPEDRQATVRAMLERSGRREAGYWLQLLLAMGIATLGLVLGSTAVVIGAMLISPLMGPIVELGMGLAIGSPYLVVRSAARVTVSVVTVIACAALLTLALPFHEVTTEIAARTSPNALDLAIAVCCAIAAAYTAARPGSDTTSTPVVADADAGIAWMGSAIGLIDQVSAADSLRGCVEVPAASKQRTIKGLDAVVAAVRASAGFQTGRVSVQEGQGWRARVAAGACDADGSAALDGGSPDGGSPDGGSPDGGPRDAGPGGAAPAR